MFHFSLILKHVTKSFCHVPHVEKLFNNHSSRLLLSVLQKIKPLPSVLCMMAKIYVRHG